MLSIHALPVEVLLMILEYASVDTSAQRRLLLTCKAFKSLIEPRLYSKVKLVPTAGWPRLTTKCPVVLFYCTVRENDRLARIVREIAIQGLKADISYVWYNTEDDDQKSDGKAEWLAERLSDPLARLHTIGRRHFYQIIPTDVVIGLLLLRLTNLESLRLHYVFWQRNSFFPAALYGKFMKKLKNVWIEIDEGNVYEGDRVRWVEKLDITPIPTSHLRSLLELPHMESITCTANDYAAEGLDRNGYEVFGPLRRPCDSLTRLRFRASRLKPSTLRYILAATPRLRDFEYENCILHGDIAYFDCEELHTILQPVQHTLERLRFEDGYNVRRGRTQRNGTLHFTVRGRIRSLTSFTRLNRLEISLACLLGESPHDQIQLADILPRSLRFLCLFAVEPRSNSRDREWDHASMFDRIATYVTIMSTFESDLVGIGLYRLVRPTESGMAAYYRLSELCTRAGVELWVHSHERLISRHSRPRHLELWM